MASPAAATALATLYAKEKLLMERSFNHLTGGALQALDQQLLQELNKVQLIADACSATKERERKQQKEEECHLILAYSCIRYIAHWCLGKYAQLLSSQHVVKDALNFIHCRLICKSNLRQTIMTPILFNHRP